MTTPHNDPSIASSDRLIRGITDDHIVPEGTGGHRLSSKAFRASSKHYGFGMSVFIEKLIHANSKTVAEVVLDDFIGCVAFTAGDARALGLSVVQTPLPENPYHGDVWRIRDGKAVGFTRPQKRGLKQQAVWVVEIPGVILH